MTTSRRMLFKDARSALGPDADARRRNAAAIAEKLSAAGQGAAAAALVARVAGSTAGGVGGGAGGVGASGSAGGGVGGAGSAAIGTKAVAKGAAWLVAVKVGAAMVAIAATTAAVYPKLARPTPSSPRTEERTSVAAPASPTPTPANPTPTPTSPTPTPTSPTPNPTPGGLPSEATSAPSTAIDLALDREQRADTPPSQDVATPRDARHARDMTTPPALRHTPSDTRARPPGSPTRLAEELALIRAMNDALSIDDVGRALELGARHARDFPAGALRVEAEGLHVVARCRRSTRGGGAEARAAAARFIDAHGQVPIVDRVRRACGVE